MDMGLTVLKEAVTLTGPQKQETQCHAGPQGKHQSRGREQGRARAGAFIVVFEKKKKKRARQGSRHRVN